MNVYFDTSALIKLVFEEDGSELAAELWDAASVATSSLLVYPEARAAVAAAHRGGRIDGDALVAANREIDELYADLHVVGIDDALARGAGELTAHHRLRGYDAVHLATAIVAIADRGVLATWDRDLADAAVGCGCTVAPA